jgi:hypothetical protein
VISGSYENSASSTVDQGIDFAPTASETSTPKPTPASSRRTPASRREIDRRRTGSPARWTRQSGAAFDVSASISSNPATFSPASTLGSKVTMHHTGIA